MKIKKQNNNTKTKLKQKDCELQAKKFKTTDF